MASTLLRLFLFPYKTACIKGERGRKRKREGERGREGERTRGRGEEDTLGHTHNLGFIPYTNRFFLCILFCKFFFFIQQYV
jgi:hypothetical protein